MIYGNYFNFHDDNLSLYDYHEQVKSSILKEEYKKNKKSVNLFLEANRWMLGNETFDSLEEGTKKVLDNYFLFLKENSAVKFNQLKNILNNYHFDKNSNYNHEKFVLGLITPYNLVENIPQLSQEELDQIGDFRAIYRFPTDVYDCQHGNIIYSVYFFSDLKLFIRFKMYSDVPNTITITNVYPKEKLTTIFVEDPE